MCRLRARPRIVMIQLWVKKSPVEVMARRAGWFAGSFGGSCGALWSLIASWVHCKGGKWFMSLSVVAAFLGGGSGWDAVVDGVAAAGAVPKREARGGVSRPPDLTLSQI